MMVRVLISEFLLLGNCLLSSTLAIVAVFLLQVLCSAEITEDKLQCSCTTPECRQEGRTSCIAINVCYVQIIPAVSRSNFASGSAAVADVTSASPTPTPTGSTGDVMRGCIDDRTPLLCENRRPSTYSGAWPVLHCCNDDWCNRDVIPTLPAWADDVRDVQLPVDTISGKVYDVNDDAAMPYYYVYDSPYVYVDDSDDSFGDPPTNRRDLPLAGDDEYDHVIQDGVRPGQFSLFSAATRSTTPSASTWRSTTWNPLLVGVPAACLCLVLSIVVLVVLLLRYRRERRTTQVFDKESTLLPARCGTTSVTFPPPSSSSSSPMTEMSANQLGQNCLNRHCVCVQCHMPLLLPAPSTGNA